MGEAAKFLKYPRCPGLLGKCLGLYGENTVQSGGEAPQGNAPGTIFLWKRLLKGRYRAGIILYSACWDEVQL